MSNHVRTPDSKAIGKGARVPLIGRIRHWLAVGRSVKYVKHRQADVLIVDTHDGVMGECLEAGVTSFELPIRGEVWYINFRIVYNLIRYARHVLARRIGLRGLYVLAVAISFRSRVVTTFIDNNNWDKGLVDLGLFRLMCVQNGYRRLPELEGKTFDVYCTMNDLPVHLFGQYGIKSNKTKSTGSLRLSIFEQNVWQVPSPVRHEPGDNGPLKVLMPSGFRIFEQDAGWTSEKNRIQREGEEKICAWLGHLEREGKIEVTVALTTGSNPDIENAEIAFFESQFGFRPKLSHRTKDRWASYRALMQADATVGAGSTILLESDELGIPTLFCFSVYNESHYEFFNLGIVEGAINLLPRNSEFDEFRAAVLALGLERNTGKRQGRNAVETIRAEVSELLKNPPS